MDSTTAVAAPSPSATSRNSSSSMVVPLRPYQRDALFFAVLVFLAATARMAQSERYSGLWWGLSDPWHPVHVFAARVLPWVVALLSLATAYHTTVRVARNWNAMAHAAQRVGINLVYATVAIPALAAATTVALPWANVSVPLASALHALLCIHEESLVWVRVALHARAANVKAGNTDVVVPEMSVRAEAEADPTIDTGAIDQHTVKGPADWALYIAFILVGMVTVAEVGLAGFAFYASHSATIASVVIGYAGWYGVYVQWYDRAEAPGRAALPGNFHDYSAGESKKTE
ncbi:hypothetical protein BC828DRAFT_405836 [Blastocladiella britannica]|nr:hypothetical protein BC828DRAFT_405836 [Blastocladiella britannica]